MPAPRPAEVRATQKGLEEERAALVERGPEEEQGASARLLVKAEETAEPRGPAEERGASARVPGQAEQAEEPLAPGVAWAALELQAQREEEEP